MGEVAKTVDSMVLKQPSRKLDAAQRGEVREFIQTSERAIAESPARINHFPHTDHFADGVYARELFIPAGVVVTSKIHKTDHFAFVLEGVAEVMDENSGYEMVVAPCMVKTKAGTKRLVRILEDTIWITVHAADETDVDAIEKRIIATEHLDVLEGVI